MYALVSPGINCRAVAILFTLTNCLFLPKKCNTIMYANDTTLYSNVDDFSANSVESYINDKLVFINNNNNMLIVQYPMQFSGPPRNISNPCSAPLCAGEWWFN